MNTEDYSKNEQENTSVHSTFSSQADEMISPEYRKLNANIALDLGTYITAGAEYSINKPHRKIIKGFIKE